MWEHRLIVRSQKGIKPSSNDPFFTSCPFLSPVLFLTQINPVFFFTSSADRNTSLYFQYMFKFLNSLRFLTETWLNELGRRKKRASFTTCISRFGRFIDTECNEAFAGPFYGAVSLDRQVSGEVCLPQLSFLQEKKKRDGPTINMNLMIPVWESDLKNLEVQFHKLPQINNFVLYVKKKAEKKKQHQH